MAAKTSEGEKLDPIEKSHTRQTPPPTIVEWGIRGLSLLIIAGLLGYFVVTALNPDIGPTFKFKVRQDKIEQRANRWAVPVDVINEGTKSVHALRLRAMAGNEEATTRRATERMVSILLIGPGEELTTEFWFDEDPRNAGVTVEVLSYILP